jgi:predicted aldo/keto reductase-like oxidoreductase
MKNIKKPIDRRTFLKTTTLGSVSLALSVGIDNKTMAGQAENSTDVKEIPYRILGKTGASIPILGMGCDDWVTKQSLLRIAFNLGVRYWDASSVYENGKTEIGIGQYFAKYPENRGKVFIASRAAGTVDPKEMTYALEQSSERMQTDYIDWYSLHGAVDLSALTPEMKAWAEQKKKEGKIRLFGFTSHANMAEMMMGAAKHSWIDVVMMSYNYRLINDDDIKKGMDAIEKAGIGFIAMKPQGKVFAPPQSIPPGSPEGSPPGPGVAEQGSPPGPPPEMQAADEEPEDLSAMSHFIEKGYTLEQAKLKLLWEDARVAACLTRMSNLTMLKDNIAAATDSRKLSSLDIKVLNRLAEKTYNFYCKGCMRCESVMSPESRIPDVLRYMMYYNSYGESDEARRQFRELPDTLRSSLASRDYSPAESICPNKIKIGEAMKEAVRLLA